MIRFRKSEELDLSLETMKERYLASLSAPMDGMWEHTVLGRSDYWLIQTEKRDIGFFSVFYEEVLVQFYLKPDYLSHAAHLFRSVFQQKLATRAVAGTNDPFFFTLCMDQHSQLQPHTYLFEDVVKVKPILTQVEGTTFRLANKSELKKLRRFYLENADFRDPNRYIDRLLERHQLYVLYHRNAFLNNSFLAVGEFRVSITQPPYVDLGIVVSEKYRGKGIGAYMMAKMKELCYTMEKTPICSCENANQASRRAIEKAGFSSRHRMWEFEFNKKSAPPAKIGEADIGENAGA